MQVKVSAFSIEIDSTVIDVSRLADHLVMQSGQEFEANKYFYFDNDSFPGFCVGVVITVKDQRSYCTLDVGANGSTLIRVNGLDENNQIMDFNFFAFNIESGVGLYQHYHQSAALSCLERKLKHETKLCKASLIEFCEAEEVDRLGRALKKRESTLIHRRHKAITRVSPIVSQDGLRAVLREYQKIKRMEYSYATLSASVREATPLGRRVSKKTEVITFANSSIVDTLSREIVSAVRGNDFSRGRVFVEDADGIEKSIKIFDMPEVLWEENYDNVVAMIDNIDPGDFGGNEYLASIVGLFDEDDYSHILQG